MRINKAVQYGLLLALYLSRSGRTTIASASEGLKVPPNMLAIVARSLKKGKVVRSVRGPGGGYELLGEPLVMDVFNAISPVDLLSNAERTKNMSGCHERRALNQYTRNLSAALAPLLNRKIKNVGMELVASDMAKLNQLSLARVN